MLLCSFSRSLFCQHLFEKSDSLNTKRLVAVSATTGAAWAGSIAALHFVWYSNFDKAKFHFFNDGNEWMQMDKIGHATTAWYASRFASSMYDWAGLKHRRSILIGAGFSFAYLATFEMLDAYNADWGFSWWDITANTSGALFYWSQEYAWYEQKFKLKFSVHNSGLAQYRPNVLGNDFVSRTLKDYNGQTYWLSFNPITLIKPDFKIPNWINISFGYSINNHLVGEGGTYILNNGTTQRSFVPYRQYFLSLDIDFESIPVKNKFLRIVLKGLNVFKVPFPALEISQGKATFRSFYF